MTGGNAGCGKGADRAQRAGQAKEEALKLEKAQIENGIKNSAGSVREQWNYRMAVLREKMKTAKQEEAALK